MFGSRKKPGQTPLAGVDVALFDLDGVVYKGADAIPFAIESINRATELVRVGYLTNNASRTDASVAEHLSSLGLTVAADDVVTSPQAGIRVLKSLIPDGATVMVVGGEGITHELERAGYAITRSALDNPAAVIQGFAPTVGWEQLAEASFALHSTEGEEDVPWVATNTDWTIPVARGIAPGNGTLVSAVHTAIGRLPLVAGKPEIPMFEVAQDRFGAQKAIVVGDRLDTDILGANRAGIASALVLTGIDQAKQVLAAVVDQRPTYILTDLRELHEDYPETVETARGKSVVTTVGDCVVVRTENTLVVEKQGSAINRLRAGAAAIWSSGLAIYGLRVPAELYS
jgi:HAD superfamily hydrolase (TIGR01450 family)